MKLIAFTIEDGPVRGGMLEQNIVRPFAGTGTDPVLATIVAGRDPEFTGELLRMEEVRLQAPLLSPPRVFGVGLNYREHAAESKMAVQAVPTIFVKLSSSVVGPDAEVILPSTVSEPDYEVELAVVIGREGFQIPERDWEQHVFGYCIANDVSARDVQLATTQWTLGKSFPTFLPLGPWITTRDEITDPHSLAIQLRLNGEVMQSANTRDLIFRVPQLLAYLSGITPLKAGDVILTGTPSGVGMGRKPPRWLKPGEEMVLEIESLGTLRNRTRREGEA